MMRNILPGAALLSFCFASSGFLPAANLEFGGSTYSADSINASVPKPAAADITGVPGTSLPGARTWDYPAGVMLSGVFYRTRGNSTPERNLSTAVADFPGSGAFLWYKGLSADPNSLPESFFAAARAAKVIPQIGFESNSYDLPTMRRALASKGALPGTGETDARTNACYKQLAAWAAYLKDKGPINFRPLSEMNDASGAWQMGKPENGPGDFAAVWNGMHALFDELGAANLRWTFTPLGVYGNPRLGLVRQALKLIPRENIDNVGINPYSMRSGGSFESFKSLVDPWLKVFAQTGHAVRPVISEMGVSNNPKSHNVEGNKDPDYVAPGSDGYRRLDAQRARWIHEAFAYAREKKFASVTYFDQQDTCWRLDKGSLAFMALQEEIARR